MESKLTSKMAMRMNIDDFKYTVRYHRDLRGMEGSGLKACSYMAEDIISKAMYSCKGFDALFYEPRYFSRVIYIEKGAYHWLVSIDFDLLDLSKFEIVVSDFKGSTDIRVHVKNDKWFDTISEIQNIDLIREAVIMHKTVEKVIEKFRSAYAYRYTPTLPERYASDFEDTQGGTVMPFDVYERKLTDEFSIQILEG